MCSYTCEFEFLVLRWHLLIVFQNILKELWKAVAVVSVRRSTWFALEISVLILMAFITGNSSLEPLLEVLLAEIHIHLSWKETHKLVFSSLELICELGARFYELEFSRVPNESLIWFGLRNPVPYLMRQTQTQSTDRHDPWSTGRSHPAFKHTYKHVHFVHIYEYMYWYAKIQSSWILRVLQVSQARPNP